MAATLASVASGNAAGSPRGAPKRRRYKEAIGALEDCIRLEPEMAQAHYRLGQACRIGREDLAQKAFETFERLQARD